MLRLRFRLAAAAALLAAPSVAFAAEPLLTPAGVFVDAAPFQKVLMLGLVAAIIAAVAIGIMKAPAAAGRTRGAAFVAALRLAGPLVGVLGATYSSLSSAIGVANVQPADLIVIAPGLAESLLVLGLGVLAGTVAVFAHEGIEARAARASARS